MTGFEVSVDYIRFTIPTIDVEQVVKLFPGTFLEGKTQRYGYTRCFSLQGADGAIFIYTGKLENPREVHADISGGVIRGWTYDYIQKLSTFVQDHNGHCGRFDVAFDDKSSGVTVDRVLQAVEVGQVVKRSRQIRIIKEIKDGQGLSGYTLYFGSRVSDSFVRTYDKQLEQRQEDGHWVRWELELKNERSDIFFKLLPHQPAEDFKEFAIGLLRSCIDFRDVTPDMESWEKASADMLPWWSDLCMGFKKARLQLVQGSKKKIADVKDWAAKSLAPMLAVLSAHPDAGEQWLRDMIVTGPNRWKQRHYDLLQRIPKQTYILRARVA